MGLGIFISLWTHLEIELYMLMLFHTFPIDRYLYVGTNFFCKVILLLMPNIDWWLLCETLALITVDDHSPSSKDSYRHFDEHRNGYVRIVYGWLDFNFYCLSSSSPKHAYALCIAHHNALSSKINLDYNVLD